MNPELVPLMFAWFVVFVFSTTLHEAAHAFAALRLGDSTAYQGGQVSLNPAPHIQREPFGMVLVPIISFFLMGGQWMIGWASAPYDPTWARRHPRRSALMALAGPVGNLLLVLVAVLLLRFGFALGWFEPGFEGLSAIVQPTEAPGAQGLATLLSILFTLNLVLFAFNLLPLPPLDGSAVIQLVMSDSMARGYQELMANPMWAIVGLVAAWRIFPAFFWPIYQMALGVLMIGV